MRTSKFHTKRSWWESAREKAKGICGFYGSGEAYVRFNMEALWHVLKMYGVGGKLLS